MLHQMGARRPELCCLHNKALCVLKECRLSQNLARIASPNGEMFMVFLDQGRNFNIFGGVSGLPFKTSLTILVTVFNQMALGPVSSPSKIHCTAVFAPAKS